MDPTPKALAYLNSLELRRHDRDRVIQLATDIAVKRNSEFVTSPDVHTAASQLGVLPVPAVGGPIW